MSGISEDADRMLCDIEQALGHAGLVFNGENVSRLVALAEDFKASCGGYRFDAAAKHLVARRALGEIVEFVGVLKPKAQQSAPESEGGQQ